MSNASHRESSRREEILRTDEVLALFPQVSRMTLHRWVKNKIILEPAINPQTRERVWTKVEIDSLFRHLLFKGLWSRKVA